MSDPYLWETFINLGKEAFSRQDYQQAEEAYVAALEQADQFGAVDPRLALTLNNLAAAHQAQGKLHSSFELLGRALGITVENLGETHPEVGLALSNLATVCQELGRTEQAERYLTESLELARQAPPERLDQTLESLANFYTEQRRPARAVEVLREMVTARMRHYGVDHAQVAAALLQLSQAQEQSGDHVGAEASRQRGLKLYQSRLGDQDPQMAQVLLAVGSQLQASGNLAQAVSYQRQGHDILANRLGASHPMVGDALESLAATYASLGQLDQAEDACRQTLAIREAAFGQDDFRVGSAVKNLAGICLTGQRLEEAEALYQRSLEIFRLRLGKLHPAVLATLEELAQLYHHSGRYEQALAVTDEVTAATLTRFGPDHPTSAQALASSGLVAFLGQNFERALDCARQALDIWERQPNPNPQVLANCQFNIACALEELGRSDELLPHLEKAAQTAGPSLAPQVRAKLEKHASRNPAPNEGKDETGGAMTEVRPERRQSPRKNAGLNKFLSAELRANGETRPMNLFLVDLSHGGMRVNVDHQLPDGQFDLSIPLAELEMASEGTIDLPCRVVWMRDLVGGTFVHGLAFSNPVDESKERLEQFLSGLSEMHRRSRYRLYRLLPIQLKAHDQEDWTECYAGNLSPEGLGLQLDTPLPEEQDFSVRLMLEFGLPVVQVVGQVAWTRQVEDKYHIGIQFKDVDPVEARTVARYIARCLDGGQ